MKFLLELPFILRFIICVVIWFVAMVVYGFFKALWQSKAPQALWYLCLGFILWGAFKTVSWVIRHGESFALWLREKSLAYFRTVKDI